MPTSRPSRRPIPLSGCARRSAAPSSTTRCSAGPPSIRATYFSRSARSTTSGSPVISTRTISHACEIVLVDITGDPDVVERAEREKYVARIDGGPALHLVVDDGAADRRAHPDNGIGRLDGLDVGIAHPEKLQFAFGSQQ